MAGIGPVSAQAVSWVDLFDSSEPTTALAVAADTTGIYVVGHTQGAFPGQTHSGAFTDAFLRKYDPSGSVVWTRQFGGSSPGSSFNIANAVHAGPSGIIVGGRAAGPLPGESEGSGSAFVRSYDAMGDVKWTRRFQVNPFEATDVVFGLSVAADGTLVVAGQSAGTPPGGSSEDVFSDAFVGVLDDEGEIIWMDRQVGCGSDTCESIATSVSAAPSGIYTAGWIAGELPGQSSSGDIDAYVRRHGYDGEIDWARQFGSVSMDLASGISTASSGVYVVGTTYGSFPGRSYAGAGDVFVRRYGTDGSHSWTDQFGKANLDRGLSVFAGKTGIYVGGGLGLDPEEPARSGNGFVQKYGPRGRVVWTTRIKTSSSKMGPVSGVSAPPQGIFAAGWRGGSAFATRIESDRPDARISRRAGGGYLGDGIYNISGKGQTLGVKVRPGQRTTVFILAENDGHVADRFAIAGCRSSKGFLVRYLEGVRGSTDITSRVAAGTYKLKVVPGLSEALRMQVTAGGALSSGATKACKVIISSANAVDAVSARVRAT